MTPTQKETIDAYTSGLKKLEELFENYNVPDFMQVTIDTPARLTTWCYSNDREKILSAVGEAFGTSDWTAEEDNRRIDWHKEVDGVQIRIYAANTIPVPPPRPVNPSEFPLLLCNQ